jgi:uncharacterized protein involved in outer membrane biogenesis
MRQGRAIRSGRTRWVLWLALIAIVIPWAVEMRWTGWPTAAIRAPVQAGAPLVVSESVEIVPSLPLILDRGVLASAGDSPVGAEEHVGKLVLDGAAFRIPFVISGTEAAQPARAASAPPLAPLLAQLAALNFGTLTVNRSRIDFVMASGVAVAFTDVALEITATRKGAFRARGTGTLFGKTVKLDASGSIPVSDHGPGARQRPAVPLKASLRAHNFDATFQGRLLTGDVVRLVGTADLRSRRLRALARWFGLTVPPSGDLRDATIAGDLEWSEGRMSFTKATVTVDGNKGEGAVTLRLGGLRPAIDGTLSFKRFDVTPHVNAQLKGESGDDTGHGTQNRPSGSLVTAFDADLRLSAEKVVAPALEAGRGALTMALKGGRMQADLAELELEGGIVSGQMLLETAGEQPKLTVKGKATRIDAGRVFTEFLKRNPLVGRSTIVLEGAGTGPTLPDMLASFSGKGAFTVAEGTRLGLDLKALAYAAGKANSVGWAAAGRGSTPLDGLEFRFQLANGALTIDELKGRSPLVGDLQGSGKVDISGRLMDLSIAVGGSPAGVAPATEPPAGGNVLVFRGSWGDPAIRLLGKPFTSPLPSPLFPALKGATTGIPSPSPSAGR